MIIRKVIDVSKYQGTIDWKAVAASDVWGAIIRAGYGREVSQEDPYFRDNYYAARDAGLKVGAYWYSYAADEADARREADACLTVLGGRALDLPLFFDQEEASVPVSLRSNIFRAFADRIGPSIPVGYYTYHNYLWQIVAEDGKVPENDCLWIADYRWDSDARETWGCDIWQYTSRGNVAGISADVDINHFYDNHLFEQEANMDYIIIGPASSGDIDTLREKAEGLGLVCTIGAEKPGSSGDTEQIGQVLDRLTIAGKALAGEVQA